MPGKIVQRLRQSETLHGFVIGIYLATAMVLVIAAGCFPTAYYMAPATATPPGSDSNPGTLSAPFLTLPKCQSAMNGSSTKLCYLRAGTYAPAGLNACNSRGNCAVGLTTADNGETYSYYPPDGVNSASITGGSTACNTGLWAIFYTGGATNVTFNGLAMHNFNFAAIQSGGGTGLTVTNSLMYNGYGIIGNTCLSGAQNAAAVMCYDCDNATISHNAIHDMASLGVSISHSSGTTNNLLYDSNVLYNTCTQIQDCGALYTQDLAHTSTNQRATNNFIWDGCLFSGCGTGSGGWGSALYLDDCASNWTVDHNVFRSQSGSNNLMIHGGINNAFTSNIVDLATNGQPILREQASGNCTASGNSFGSSIIISHGAAGGFNIGSGVTIPTDSTHKNTYWNYGTGTLSSSGDSSPVTGSNPQINCYNYQVQSGSPVFASPINFTIMGRGWGPPNYVLPQTGTQPSQPHAC